MMMEKTERHRFLPCVLILITAICLISFSLLQLLSGLCGTTRMRSEFYPASIASSEAHGSATVVTSYYQIPSKHSHKKYLEWMSNFLAVIPCSLYVVTDNQSNPTIEEMRFLWRDRTVIDVRDMASLDFEHSDIFWIEQRRHDPQRHVPRGPELYMVWHLKTRFVMEAIETNPFDSEYFIWCDIGSFRRRDHAQLLKNFPNISTLETLNTKRMYLLAIGGQFSEDDLKLRADGLPKNDMSVGPNRMSGGVMVGHRNAWIRWNQKFYYVARRLTSVGRFIGDDQAVMASVVVLFPELVQLIYPKPYYGDAGNEWFYLQYFFS
ncbi:hypothetical protein RvY_08499 [Ramazzottius varieornatus]|uniref:Uncharacterized protein n=1 Tax=Ramazzottius varieornatus TaxID=947166 RepID=A0A1D1VBM3_RAMVA|nr:hypothetical protein RvY_08499 [Ramazzottius varieornatus]